MRCITKKRYFQTWLFLDKWTNWKMHLGILFFIFYWKQTNYISSFLGHILRYTWDGQEKRDYSLDLKRIPFCTDQQVLKAVPLSDKGVFVSKIAYSPLIGGYAVVFNDGRAAFLFSSTVNFDPNVRLFQITLWLFERHNYTRYSF